MPYLYLHSFIDGAYEEWFSADGVMANIILYSNGDFHQRKDRNIASTMAISMYDKLLF